MARRQGKACINTPSQSNQARETEPSPSSRKRTRSEDNDLNNGLESPKSIASDQLLSPEKSSKRQCVNVVDETRDAGNTPIIKAEADPEAEALDKTGGIVDTTVPLTNKIHLTPIEHWARHSVWPKAYFKKKQPKMAAQVVKKRSHSQSSRSTSYTQSVRDGYNPRAHTRGHEHGMKSNQMIMDVYAENISDESKQLCNDLTSGTYDVSDEPLYEWDNFVAVLRRSENRNEARVFRDLTPVIVSSVERLYLDGKGGNLEHLIEEIDAPWSRSATIFGPQPKPDYAVGLASTAFTDEEVDQLQRYHTSLCPAFVTEFLYFPLLVCEVKDANEPLQKADRQTMHSASIAANAVVNLYRKVNRADELNKKVLTFSISHNARFVSIYGHYAVIEDGKTTFYRHLIQSVNFAQPSGEYRWTSYNFTRKVYDDFCPAHLERIRSALEDMRESEAQSESQEADGAREGEAVATSEDVPPSVPSSQYDGEFRRPALPLTVVLEKEKEALEAKVAEMAQQQENARAEMAQQQENARAEAARQQEAAKKEAEERENRMREMLERQMERQMDRQMKQQAEQMDRQMKLQMEQNKKEKDALMKHIETLSQGSHQGQGKR